MDKKFINFAIFASGNGTNAENIIKYFSKKPFKPTLVICNNPGAKVLERAARLGVPSEIIRKKDISDEKLVTETLKRYDIDFIVLAGWMVMIPEFLVKLYPHRIVNIHPALLPKFGGKGMYGHHVHEAVYANHEKETGITIHFVDEKYDNGEIFFQAKVALSPSDTPEVIEEKIHVLEQTHFPKVIEQILLKEF